MVELHVVKAQPVLDSLPAVLTVEEAAEVLRIGRGTAYELARQWRETEGRCGLPVVMLGRCLRVRRAALLQLLDVHVDGDSIRASDQ